MDFAKDLISRAEHSSRSGQLEEALVWYQQALNSFVVLYRDETDPSRKAEMFALIERYMSEAERIKAQQSRRAAPAPAPNSFHSLASRPAPTSSASARSAAPSSARRAAASTEGAARERDEYSAQILEEIVDTSPGIHWADIAGLEFAKQSLQEAVVLPNLRPDLFTGLRRPPKGVLLFGPPGTGKTLLAKAVATETGFAFFSISASSVTSRYHGDGEKLMRALFAAARERQPAVIFFDEIDALLSARKDGEHEASRRLKTEFMTQLDGATTTGDDRILIMAATNLPWELDEAVLRRLTKRIYIPLPDKDARRALLVHLLQKQGPRGAHMPAASINKIVAATDGYSGSDLAAVCQEAALGPIREINASQLRTVKAEDVRPIREQDFLAALKVIRPSNSKDRLHLFTQWTNRFAASR